MAALAGIPDRLARGAGAERAGVPRLGAQVRGHEPDPVGGLPQGRPEAGGDAPAPAHAREHGGELREWRNETQAAAHALGELLVGGIWDRLPRPDGAGTWAEDGRQVSFLLEFDTGTEHLPVLADKLDGYALLASVLAEAGQAAPPLLFCFGSPRREQGARTALAACRDSAAVRIATTAIDPYATSPAGPLWLPLSGHTGRQVRLVDLGQALPDPWQDYRAQRARESREAPNARKHCAAPTRTTTTPG
jgi:Replication-relaxation